jgi:hypothetical protein
MAVVRRLLAGDLPWRAVARGLVPFVLTLVPRRLLLLIAAAAVTWLLLGVVVLVALAQLLA